MFVFDAVTLLVVWFELCNVCVSSDSEWIEQPNSENGVLATSTKQTFANVTIPPVTVAPSGYINYTLEISSSGPAILDSIMTFTAKLKDGQGHYAQSKLFKYLWTNTADMEIKKTVDDYDASIECKFLSDEVVPGQYLMTVTVYVRHTWPKTIVAFGSLQIDLTETLNGNMNLSQQLAYQRVNSTFSTGEIMRIHANITDKFSSFKNPLLKASFRYFWCKNNTLVESTDFPFYYFTPSVAGNLTLSTKVVVILEPEETSRYNASLFLSSQRCECRRMHRMRPAHNRLKNDAIEKCGIMKQPIAVKESLKFVRIDGDTSCPIGGSAKINVTCEGSFSSYPVAVCWNITDANYSLPTGKASCEPMVFVNSCEHHVEIQLNSTGSHAVWFTVYNDVGFITGKHIVCAYDPDSKSSPLLVIPIVFSVIGLVIILLGVGFIFRLRKKPLVEVADFDFHPSLYEGKSLLTRAKNVLSKGRSSSSLHRYESPRNRPYGSLDIHETL